MWQLPLNGAPHNLKDDGNTGGIIGAKVGGAIAVEDAVTQYWLVSKAWGYTIHMGVEQEWCAFSRKGGDEVAVCVNLCT